MIARALALAGGVLGGAGASQFPEFSQQYVQRLGGAVDALGQVVADFDASATAEGLSRDAALAQMTGTAMVERRRSDMERTFARHDRLSHDLAVLTAATPLERALNAHRLTDGDIVAATRAAYVPAVPVSTQGAMFAACGFLAGWLAVALALRGLFWPLRRRRRARLEPAPVQPLGDAVSSVRGHRGGKGA